MDFPTDKKAIESLVANIDISGYAKTRNFKNGNVSMLSPYISRGVISLSQIIEVIKNKSFEFHDKEKFFQELAWREYWQHLWVFYGDKINQDLKKQQPDVCNEGLSDNIIKGTTGINAIDTGIKKLYQTGYMHNHMRMYVSSIACNISKSHWKTPSKWMYYHLLDADWASNALSWQWVAAANSGKKYFANQSNINHFFNDDQSNTFLDVEYEEFDNIETPDELKNIIKPDLETPLPKSENIIINKSQPTYIYDLYNLDYNWGTDIKSNRILFFNTEVFTEYPVSEKLIKFVLNLSENIPNIQVFVGNTAELKTIIHENQLHSKEHPLNKIKGNIHQRDWLVHPNVEEKKLKSFFKFWNSYKKQILHG